MYYIVILYVYIYTYIYMVRPPPGLMERRRVRAKTRGVLLPGADLPKPLCFGIWDGRVTDSSIAKATKLLRHFLIEAVPLEFLVAL